jgi:hypothetical protein
MSNIISSCAETATADSLVEEDSMIRAQQEKEELGRFEKNSLPSKEYVQVYCADFTAFIPVPRCRKRDPCSKLEPGDFGNISTQWGWGIDWLHGSGGSRRSRL